MCDESLKLHAMTLGGNCFEAVRTLNSMGLASHVVDIDSNGHYTIVVIKAPAAVIDALRAERRELNLAEDAPPAPGYYAFGRGPAVKIE